MCGGDSSHLTNSRRWFETDNVAFAADRVIGQRAVVASAPARGEFAKGTMEDHGEKVVDQRCVPAGEQLLFEFVVVRDQFVQTHLRKLRVWQSKRLIEANVKSLDLTVQREIVSKQAKRCAHAAQRVQDS